MYCKDKDERITLRLSTEQLNFIDKLAVRWSVKRSDILRIIIDTYRGDRNANK